MDYVELAEKIATKAHDGQFDKLGVPYIEHPRAVVAKLVRDGESDPAVIAAAWLHDVLEDARPSFGRKLFSLMPEKIMEALDALSQLSNEPRDQYYERVRQNLIALRVKRADVWHNSLPERLSGLDKKTRERLEQKYAKARKYLGT